jgi:glucose/arabinose dehydrogenase
MFMKSAMKNTFYVIGIFSLVAVISIVPGCKKDKGPITINPNLQLIASNLVAPLSVVEAPDDSKRLFIVDQVGKVWIVPSTGAMLSTPFMDVSSKMVTLSPGYDERGLLSIAFHPNFKTNGKLYAFYTAPPRAGGPGTGWNNLTRISEFKVSASNNNQVDLATERILLEADHPQLNHNGGTLAFGPDGYLYISIGDGGNKDDVGAGHQPDWYPTNAGGNAQNLHDNLMGKILRIDVNSGSPYSIPADNPFVGMNAKPEIYAFGFRNPYRFSFDMGGSHQLFVGDAGQSLYEEIDIVTKGGNYGWNVKEGTACFSTDDDLTIRPSCPSVDSAGKTLLDPFIQLKNKAHPDGNGIATVIVGGNVYRGNAMPDLQGSYIFGIFSQGGSGAAGANAKLYMTNAGAVQEFVPKDFPNNLGYYLKGFGQDLSGEIYITTSEVQGVSGTSGKVYKIVAAQ